MPTKFPVLHCSLSPLKARLATLVGGLLAVLAIVAALPSTGQAEHLVRNEAAARLGLQRAWFAQVRVDPTRHKIVHWVFDKNQIIALTSGGVIQAIDAETGRTLWTTELGVGHAPAAGVAVNDKYVALLGAGRIYIIDRQDGHHLWSRLIGGASSAAPALSKRYAYVVLVNGRVEGYRLDDPKAQVWQYQSDGRTFQNPTATGKVVSWPTDKNLLYVGAADKPNILFRIETHDEIIAPPAERYPYLYVGSLDGYLYSFHELNGGEQWRYSTGFAITSQPAIVENSVFVASQGPSLHSVNATTGRLQWKVDGAKQFVAMGKRNTYGMNRYGTLLVINSKTGGVVGRLPTGETNQALVNDKSDRIFIVNNRGLIQCLHEIGVDEPVWHRAPPVVEESKEKKTVAEDPFKADVEVEEPKADSEENPFATDDGGLEEEGDDDGFGGFDDANPFQ